MKRCCLIVINLIVFVAWLLPAAHGAPVVIRMGHDGATAQPYHPALELTAKIIAEKTNNEVNMQIFPTGQLGSQQEQMLATIQGTQEMWMSNPAWLAQYSPRVGILGAAYLFRDLDHMYKYAVRSSANIDDDSSIRLRVSSRACSTCRAWMQCYKPCGRSWAMVDAANIQAYMKQLRRDPRELKMAVIVQEMVPPVISGVAFSKNPMTGLDEIVVEAVRGRGDQLVQGGVTPARWVYKWGEWIAQPAQTDVSLDVIAQVVSGVKQIARAYGSPIDLEWVYDGQRVQWVQLREIKTLSTPYRIERYASVSGRPRARANNVSIP